MSQKTDRIISKVLAMDDTQLAKFVSSLSADARRHLDVILAKAEQKYKEQ